MNPYLKFLAAIALVILAYILLAIGMSPEAKAFELSAARGGEVVRFFDGACQDPRVVERIRPEAREYFRAGEAILSGQYFSMCWRPVKDNMAVVYEDGDTGAVPMSDVKDNSI